MPRALAILVSRVNPQFPVPDTGRLAAAHDSPEAASAPDIPDRLRDAGAGLQRGRRTPDREITPFAARIGEDTGARTESLAPYRAGTAAAVHARVREPLSQGDQAVIDHQHPPRGLVAWAVLIAFAAAPAPQTGVETFSATAAIQTAGGASATAPVTIDVTRKMSQQEADTMTSAFINGGVAGLRKALAGVTATGSIQIGSGKPTPTRLTLERQTDRGRMLTIVTDRPLMFLGAGLPEAKPKEGYDFGIVDVIVDATGGGTGTISTAAKVAVRQGVFVVDDYSGELIRLNNIKKVR
jgi:hypothetical protein